MMVSVAELTVPMVGTLNREEPADPAMARLVALALDGNRVAFGRLLEHHLGAARRLALAAVGQASDADEAVQDASIAAWQRLDALQDPGAFRAWFMRIVWRKALDRRRSVKSWLERFGAAPTVDDMPVFEAPATDPGPDAQLMSAELAAAIRQIIRALPRRLRDPFLLAASCDHRYEDIAALLGIPMGTVKWRISEAQKMIRLKLDRLGYGGRR